ncbi:MAG TPA: DUF378 domain-containing protein [Candidatus Gracilibacteria bacterium]
MCKVAKILAAIGAINWGLIGAVDFNLVNTLVGSVPMLEKVVYILVGVAGVMVLYGAVVGCPGKK